MRVADPDPGSEPFLTLDPGSGMGKKSRSRSGMNILNHISESLEAVFSVKILNFFDADKHPVSATLPLCQIIGMKVNYRLSCLKTKLSANLTVS